MGCPTTAYRLLAAAAMTGALALAPLAAVAQESNPWFPGGQAPQAGAAASVPAAGAPEVSAPAAPSPTATDPAPGEGGGWMLTSPLANVSWPEIKMPRLQWKTPGGDPNAQQQGPGPLARVRQATQNMAQQTRMAWNKTVDRFKLGGRDASATANKQPGFFARLFGPEPTQGSETIPEFLAQERPGMTGR